MPSPLRWGVLGTGARQEGLEPQATELWKPLSSRVLEASWRWAPLNCDSDLVLDPSQSLYNFQTETETLDFFTPIISETLYSLLRTECADHQIQFTSILALDVFLGLRQETLGSLDLCR